MAEETPLFKDELLLAKSVYNTNAVRKNLEALAQVLQNIIIYEPGTFPNQPELGVGIESYQFEFLDEKTMTELKSRIDNQISKFIPSDIKIEPKVDTLMNELGKRILVISFRVNGLDNRADSYSEINMLFGKDKSNRKIISKILL
jgi:RNA binding exosome subunit